MSDDETEVDGGESADAQPKRKAPVRKPLWLLIAAGVRHIELPDGKLIEERLFTRHRCDSKADVSKTLASLKLDATNMPEIMLLRADPIVVDVSAQLVLKW